jgi:hypothetical protein
MIDDGRKLFSLKIGHVRRWWTGAHLWLAPGQSRHDEDEGDNEAGGKVSGLVTDGFHGISPFTMGCR